MSARIAALIPVALAASLIAACGNNGTTPAGTTARRHLWHLSPCRAIRFTRTGGYKVASWPSSTCSPVT